MLAAGWPESVPATTVDRQCGSSQQALHFAAQGVIAGAYDVVVAAGVEVMTRTPMGSSVVKELGFPFPKSMFDRYAETGLPPQGIGAEMIADEYGLTREDLDAFGAESQRRAAQAADEGRFDNEIVPVPIEVDGVTEMMTRDEGIREGTTVETLANLKPAFKEDGKITAGNSSQITDGASAVLVMSDEKAAELGLRPRARFHSFAVAGTDPVTMLKGPIPATDQDHGSGRACRSTRSTCSRSTRRSPRWCWRGRRNTAPTSPRPTSTAARSRSAIRSARRAPS